jgi:hypothetical protein
MHDVPASLVCIVMLGIGATALLDVWSVVRARMLHVPSLDYALVGRWLAWLPRGRFRHDPIGATPPVRGEHLLGWSAHYLIGIVFAAVLVAVAGMAWVRDPTPGPALLVGLASAVAPFLVLQPALGAGLAARRTPHPMLSRLHTLLTHAIFGLGLYATAWLAHRLVAL